MMLSRQPTKVSNEWELDFYSRPVQGPDGKKLWELLVTDAQGTFQHVEAVPSNCVNSRELRARVQRLIDDTPLKPKKIRFFRTQMKNMISIALGELPDVECKPSRVTYALYASQSASDGVVALKASLRSDWSWPKQPTKTTSS